MSVIARLNAFLEENEGEPFDDPCGIKLLVSIFPIEMLSCDLYCRGI
jgi:hypothetical protein